jgi:excisionase family DNA binding protein
MSCPLPASGQALNRDPLLDLDAVAERLGVSIRTVRRWIASRKLKAVRIGRIVRIREDALAAMLDEFAQ